MAYIYGIDNDVDQLASRCSGSLWHPKVFLSTRKIVPSSTLNKNSPEEAGRVSEKVKAINFFLRYLLLTYLRATNPALTREVLKKVRSFLTHNKMHSACPPWGYAYLMNSKDMVNCGIKYTHTKNQLLHTRMVPVRQLWLSLPFQLSCPWISSLEITGWLSTVLQKSRIGICSSQVRIKEFTCKIATSLRSWLSCFVGNLNLSIILIATSLPVLRCLPLK